MMPLASLPLMIDCRVGKIQYCRWRVLVLRASDDRRSISSGMLSVMLAAHMEGCTQDLALPQAESSGASTCDMHRQPCDPSKFLVGRRDPYYFLEAVHSYYDNHSEPKAIAFASSLFPPLGIRSGGVNSRSFSHLFDISPDLIHLSLHILVHLLAEARASTLRYLRVVSSSLSYHIYRALQYDTVHENLRAIRHDWTRFFYPLSS
jgi:hypothetical protein